jgi:hypothetical protein
MSPVAEVTLVGTPEWGNDVVGLDLSTGQTKMKGQALAILPSLDSEFGHLGVIPTIPSSIRQGSFFQNLQNSTRIAGKTWSYQAGAFNRELNYPYALTELTRNRKQHYSS